MSSTCLISTVTLVFPLFFLGVGRTTAGAGIVIEWQIKLIGFGYVGLGLVVPALIGWWFGDTLGGIFWIGNPPPSVSCRK